MKSTIFLLVTSLSLSCTISTRASFATSAAASLAGIAGAAAATQAAAPEQLDSLLAPIALYPDPLVLQILECAKSPDEVKKVNDWLMKNSTLKGTALQDAATAEGFEPSFVAIVLFPQVVQSMAEKPEWTRELGKAFASDRNAVFASIQRLRAQAQAVGNLQSNDKQQVETVMTSGGQEIIVIQPANPEVVYVPTYSPTVVYTQPSSSGDAVVAGLVGFTAGIIVGVAIADDNPYYGCGGWGYRGAALCNEGWEDFYEHRETMARDYYQHRENMAAQRGQNQGNRQDSRTENQGNRQDSRTDNQGTRQDSRSESQAGRQERAAENPNVDRAKAKPTAASRGAASTPAARPADRSGTKSGAFSGYQSGTKERQASSRGRSSASGGSRGGGRRGR